jgi:4-hydroxy-3-methylbut-2-enyl diphosphate reductase
MSDLLVAAPLRLEALAIRSAARRLRVRTTGMGPRRARAAVPALLADPAAALLVLGFGGGLLAGSELCEVVVADEVVAVDEHGRPYGEAVVCDGADALVRALSGSGLRVRRGAVASVDQIVTGQARERMLTCGAVAVDMESAWLAQAARGRPFAVVRVLSDTPERELVRRLPVGPPLPSMADGLRAAAALRRAAGGLDRLVRMSNLHIVFGGVRERAGEVE